MSDDRPLKSAYELAMERLQRQDAERGESSRALTDAEKKAIARCRREAKAKIAEIEIMHEQKLAGAGGDPEKIAELEEKLRIDRSRVASSTESKIARIKRGEAD